MPSWKDAQYEMQDKGTLPEAYYMVTVEKFINGICFELDILNGVVVDVRLTEEGKKDIIFEENFK